MIRKVFVLVLVSFAFLAFAQDDMNAAVNVTDSEAYGPVLTDAEGMSLYLFVNAEADMSDESMTEGVRAEAKSCTEGCLDAWPPLMADEVTAGEGVNAELLYTADFDGMNMVVYNGWPLYYFASDTAPGDTTGQGKGTWHLVSPEGEPVPVGE